MSLIDLEGNELSSVPRKRRRQTSTMKKTTQHGDVLFKLIVDLPEGLSHDDYVKVMIEYFDIGSEAFRSKGR